MTSEEKNKFDSLEVLRKSAWESFNNRRTFEWKVCLSLWSAFAAFIGTILTGKGNLISFNIAVLITIICLVVIGLYLYWINGLARAHTVDKRISIIFRNEMMKMVGVQFPEDLEHILKKIRKDWPRFVNWSHALQIGLTLILAVGVIFLVWSRLPTKFPGHVRNSRLIRSCPRNFVLGKTN